MSKIPVTIKVITCRVGQAPRVEEMETGLASMQAMVGGYITCLAIDEGVDLWCNDEGLFTCEPNRLVRGQPIHGNVFIAAHDEEGETVSLPEEKIPHLLNVARGWPMAISSLV
jgi:hypothetical protein